MPHPRASVSTSLIWTEQRCNSSVMQTGYHPRLTLNKESRNGNGQLHPYVILVAWDNKVYLCCWAKGSVLCVVPWSIFSLRMLPQNYCFQLFALCVLWIILISKRVVKSDLPTHLCLQRVGTAGSRIALDQPRERLQVMGWREASGWQFFFPDWIT